MKIIRTIFDYMMCNCEWEPTKRIGLFREAEKTLKKIKEDKNE